MLDFKAKTIPFNDSNDNDISLVSFCTTMWVHFCLSLNIILKNFHAI